MLWKPNVCTNGQCQMEWVSGDLWTPDEPWEFKERCVEHSVYSDKVETLAAIKSENQDMSYGRAKLAEVLDIPEDSQADIGFVFDEDRNIAFQLPIKHQGSLTGKETEVADALALISDRLSVQQDA